MRVVPLPPAKVYAPCFRTKLRIARKMATRLCSRWLGPEGNVIGIGHHVLDLDGNSPERASAPDGALDGSLDLAGAAAHEGLSVSTRDLPREHLAVPIGASSTQKTTGRGGRRTVGLDGGMARH